MMVDESVSRRAKFISELALRLGGQPIRASHRPLRPGEIYLRYNMRDRFDLECVRIVAEKLGAKIHLADPVPESTMWQINIRLIPGGVFTFEMDRALEGSATPALAQPARELNP